MKKNAATIIIACVISFVGFCHGQGNASESACVVNCPVVGEHEPPICASDGITYGSECVLRAMQCRNASIVKLHDGKCDDSFSIVPTGDPPSVNDAFHTPCTTEPSCEKPCNNVEKKICGSNSVTYHNPCQFHNARCRIPTLRFKHAGACESLLSR